MQYQQINLNTNLFGMGAILGTGGAPELLKKINAQAGFGSSYFGSANDPFKDTYFNFMTNVVNPIREMQVQLQAANVAVQREDRFVLIESEDDLKRGVPPCMYDGILTFPPIRELAEDHRIEAFGIDVSSYPVEDEYGRLIRNGAIELIPENIKDGQIEFEWEWKSTDPIIEQEDLDILESSRIYLQEFLEAPETSHLDPTSIPYGQLRG